MDRAPEQTINKETMVLNDTLDQMDSPDKLRTFHPKTAQHIFSSAHGTSSRRDHVLGHKTGLNKFKSIKVIRCTFSDHRAMKHEVNRNKKSGRNTNTWRISNMLLNNESVTQKIKEEFFFKNHVNEYTV